MVISLKNMFRFNRNLVFFNNINKIIFFVSGEFYGIFFSLHL